MRAEHAPLDLIRSFKRELMREFPKLGFHGKWITGAEVPATKPVTMEDVADMLPRDFRVTPARAPVAGGPASGADGLGEGEADGAAGWADGWSGTEGAEVPPDRLLREPVSIAEILQSRTAEVTFGDYCPVMRRTLPSLFF